MRLSEFGLTDFRTHTSIDLVLAPITVLIGPNNVGKSSIIQALTTLSRLARFSPFTYPETGAYSFSAMCRNGGSKTFGLTSEFVPDESDAYWIQPVSHGIVCGVLADGLLEVLDERLTVGGQTVLGRSPAGSEGSLAPVVANIDGSGSSTIFSLAWRNRLQIDQSLRSAGFCLRSVGQYRLVPIFVSNPGSYQPDPDQPDDRAPRVEQNGTGVADLLLYLRSEHPAHFDELVANVSRAIHGTEYLDFRASSADPDSFEVLAKFSDDRGVVPVFQLSDGTRNLLGLLAILQSPRRFRTMCLEEPEIGLTPNAIGVLANTIFSKTTASAPGQFIISTHSPFLLESLMALSRRAENEGLLRVVVVSMQSGNTLLEDFDTVKARTPELGPSVTTLDSVDIADVLRRL